METRAKLRREPRRGCRASCYTDLQIGTWVSSLCRFRARQRRLPLSCPSGWSVYLVVNRLYRTGASFLARLAGASIRWLESRALRRICAYFTPSVPCSQEGAQRPAQPVSRAAGNPDRRAPPLESRVVASPPEAPVTPAHSGHSAEGRPMPRPTARALSDGRLDRADRSPPPAPGTGGASPNNGWHSILRHPLCQRASPEAGGTPTGGDSFVRKYTC